MGILTTIIIGFIVGLIARFLMPGRDPMGFVFTSILGIVGAILGQGAGSALGMYSSGEPVGMLMSVFGAMIVLYLYNLLTRRHV